VTVLFVDSKTWRYFEWLVWVLSPEVKLPGHEADHSPVSSAGCKTEWICTFACLVYLHGVHHDIVTFNFNWLEKLLVWRFSLWISLNSNIKSCPFEGHLTGRLYRDSDWKHTVKIVTGLLSPCDALNHYCDCTLIFQFV